MQNLIKQLWADENGFIISAELVLVGTIVGLAMVAGLSEVSSAVNNELSDVAQGFNAVNQGHGDGGYQDHGLWDSGHEGEGSGQDFGGDYGDDYGDDSYYE